MQSLTLQESEAFEKVAAYTALALTLVGVEMFLLALQTLVPEENAIRQAMAFVQLLLVVAVLIVVIRAKVILRSIRKSSRPKGVSGNLDFLRDTFLGNVQYKSSHLSWMITLFAVGLSLFLSQLLLLTPMFYLYFVPAVLLSSKGLIFLYEFYLGSGSES